MGIQMADPRHEPSNAAKDPSAFNLSARLVDLASVTSNIADTSTVKAIELLVDLVAEVYVALLLKVEREVNLEMTSSIQRRMLLEGHSPFDPMEPPPLPQVLLRPASTAKTVAEMQDMLAADRSQLVALFAPEYVPEGGIEHQERPVECSRPPWLTPAPAEAPGDALLPWCPPLQDEQPPTPSETHDAQWRSAAGPGPSEDLQRAAPLPLWMHPGFSKITEQCNSATKSFSSTITSTPCV